MLNSASSDGSSSPSESEVDERTLTHLLEVSKSPFLRPLYSECAGTNKTTVIYRDREERSARPREVDFAESIPQHVHAKIHTRRRRGKNVGMRGDETRYIDEIED